MDKSVRVYCAKCLRYAWKETNSFFQFEPKPGLFLFALALVGIYISKRFNESGSRLTVSGLLSEWIAPAVVLAVMAWLLLFGISAVLHAPYALYKRHRKLISKQASKVSALKTTLLAKRHNQKLSDLLSDKHEYAVHELLNKVPATDTDFDAWLDKENEWTKGTLDIMRQHGCTTQEIRHVHTLGLIQMIPLSPNPAISHQLSMLVTRMGRIADIAGRYGE
jgi:hypothetical protein